MPTRTRLPASTTSVLAEAPPKRKTSAKVTLPAPGVATIDGEAARQKHKLVRDSFTMPKGEYAALAALKLRAGQLARPVKKGELLRAGIVALTKMADKPFLAALNAVPSLKTGRPKDTTKKTPAKKATM